jgi:hypothetical protein
MAQINKPTDYFNTVTYTGNGGTQSVTGVGFQPNWCWIKSRSNPGVYGHETYDVIRGVRNNLSPNSTDAEFTIPTTGFESFDSDGFTVQLSDNYGRGINENNQLQVAWNWLAGGTASSNTDGSITSNVSANTTSGFSIVSYTGNGTGGATVGHGIDTPKMIIVKNRDDTDSWEIYHASLGETKYLQFTSAAPGTNTNRWNDTAPTSSVFSLGTEAGVNQSGENFIAYCFGEKKGFSKVGQYSGNSNTDGSMLYLGFKPSFIIIKDISSTDPWHIIDAKRNTVNVMNARLFPNTSGAESTSTDICDFLSTGIKFRGTNDGFNGSRTYIYYAVAEQPLVGTNNIPATAR